MSGTVATTGSISQVVDEILMHLLPERDKKPREIPKLSEAHIMILVQHMREVFMREPMMLKLQAPLHVGSDYHGQFSDLLRTFELNGYPPATRYLILGDYVDRGKYSIETICLLFALKLRYPDHMYLLRGNHEDASLNRIYGFYDECKRKYSIKLWKTFVDTFNCIPIAALIEEKILCMHGGLSPDIKALSDIDAIARPQAIPESGIMCDLLWSDPESNDPEDEDKPLVGWADNDRGISYVFGTNVVKDFNRKHGLDLIVRGHQCVEDGYQFFADKNLITVFSAPNYDNSFTNSAGMLQVDKNLICSIKVLEPVVKKPGGGL